MKILFIGSSHASEAFKLAIQQPANLRNLDTVVADHKQFGQLASEYEWLIFDNRRFWVGKDAGPSFFFPWPPGNTGNVWIDYHAPVKSIKRR